MRRAPSFSVFPYATVFRRELDLALVRLEDLLDGLLRALAERALEVGELDDGDVGLRVSLHGGRADRHLVDGLGTWGERLLLLGRRPGLRPQRSAYRAARVHLQPDEITDRPAHAGGDRDVPGVLHVFSSPR